MRPRTPVDPFPPDAPLCRTRACAEAGVRAADRDGWCADCTAGQAEDEAERRADLRREDRRFGIDGLEGRD